MHDNQQPNSAISSSKQSRQTSKTMERLQNYIKSSQGPHQQDRNLGVKQILRQLSQESLAAQIYSLKKQNSPTVPQHDNNNYIQQQGTTIEYNKPLILQKSQSAASIVTNKFQQQQFIPFYCERDHLGRKIKEYSIDQSPTKGVVQTHRDHTTNERKDSLDSIQYARLTKSRDVQEQSYVNLSEKRRGTGTGQNDRMQHDINNSYQIDHTQSISNFNTVHSSTSPQKNRISKMIEQYKKKEENTYVGDKKKALYEVEGQNVKNKVVINYQLNIKSSYQNTQQDPIPTNSIVGISNPNNNIAKKRFVVQDDLQKRKIASDKHQKEYVEKCLNNKLQLNSRKRSNDSCLTLNQSQEELMSNRFRINKNNKQLHSQHSQPSLNTGQGYNNNQDNAIAHHAASQSLITSINHEGYKHNITNNNHTSDIHYQSTNNSVDIVPLAQQIKCKTEQNEKIIQSNKVDELIKRKKTVKFSMIQKNNNQIKPPESHQKQQENISKQDTPQPTKVIEFGQSVNLMESLLPQIEQVSHPNIPQKGVKFQRAFEAMRINEERKFQMETDQIPLDFDGFKEQKSFLQQIQSAKQRLRRMQKNLNSMTKEALQFFEERSKLKRLSDQM